MRRLHNVPLTRCLTSGCGFRFYTTGAKFAVVNPATEKTIGELQEDTAQTVAHKFKQAQSAQSKWAQVPLEEKKSIITKFNELLQQNKDSLAEILSSEMGKPVKFARGEISATEGRIKYFLNNVKECMQEEVISEGEKITYEPLGVVANISAWNYPYFVGTNVIVPALLTGNTVLYKPSEFTSLTGLEITRLLYEAGVPKDVFVPVIGRGQVGADLLQHPLNGVFFTGSYATGRKIAMAVAGQLCKVQLELGGKDPTYVRADSNVANSAASLADGAMFNAGQSCCSVERIYVHKSIHDQFVQEFVKTVLSFKVGNPLDPETYMGPLTRQSQIQVLQQQISDAVSKGAKVLCGGNPIHIDGKGYFFEPTVLTNVNHSMEVMREESFGPIIGIQSVSSDEEAVELMNDTNYGLTAGVFTFDTQTAHSLLARVNSGTVYINRSDSVSPNLPWTGRKHSGVGSTLSKIGIKTFLQPKGWNMNKSQ